MLPRQHLGAVVLVAVGLVFVPGTAGSQQQEQRRGEYGLEQACATRLRQAQKSMKEIPTLKARARRLADGFALLAALPCDDLTEVPMFDETCRVALAGQGRILAELMEAYASYQDTLETLRQTLETMDNDRCWTVLNPKAAEPAPPPAAEQSPDLDGTWNGTWTNSFGSKGGARFAITREPDGTYTIRGEPGFGTWTGTGTGSTITCRSSRIEQYAYTATITINGPGSLSITYNGSGNHPRGRNWTGTVELTK